MTLKPKNKVLLLKPAGKCMTNFSVSDGGIGEVRFPTSMSLALSFEVSSMEYRNCLMYVPKRISYDEAVKKIWKDMFWKG